MKQSEFKINKGFIYQDMGKEVVIFSSENSELFTFNETAALIFKMLMKGQSPKSITDILTKKYEVKKDTLLKDIDDLILKLKKNRIIE